MFITRGKGSMTERFEIPSGQSFKALPTNQQRSLRRAVCELVGVMKVPAVSFLSMLE